MRSRILASLLLLSAPVPLAVYAQEQEEEATEADETEAVEVADTPEGSVRLGPDSGGRETSPGSVHTVESGDTLWDLSQRYLGNAWYWPKVWSYNPEIANPHWIYPGNKVRFFKEGEEVPTEVQGGDEAPIALDSGAEDFVPSTELEVNGADMVKVTGKIGYEPKASRAVTTSGFVTARELDEAGTINNAFSEAKMLSSPDVVYLRFKRGAEVRLGDKYVVFHTTKEILHPITGNKVGYLTDFLGAVKVVAVDERFVTAQITDSWEPIERGDMVGPFGENLAGRVVPRRNETQVEGYVLTSLVPYLTLLGEHHFLVIDKGSGDGVQVGNTFTVVRQLDMGGKTGTGLDELFNPSRGQNKNVPPSSIATCLVTEVKERSSNCVLTRSLVEIIPGDRAVLRVDQAPTAKR